MRSQTDEWLPGVILTDFYCIITSMILSRDQAIYRNTAEICTTNPKIELLTVLKQCTKSFKLNFKLLN